MTLYLVRHAKAGDPQKWTGDDRLRPLSKRGRRQAEHLVERFAGITVTRVVSSPYKRCMETVAPIAAAHGIELEEDEFLAYAGSFLDVVDLLEKLPENAVACSHGDVIPDVIAALYRRGMEIEGAEEWRKGSVWVLERDGDTFSVGRAWQPPDDDA